jgi:hypothetical protein
MGNRHRKLARQPRAASTLLLRAGSIPARNCTLWPLPKGLTSRPVDHRLTSGTSREGPSHFRPLQQGRLTAPSRRATQGTLRCPFFFATGQNRKSLRIFSSIEISRNVEFRRYPKFVSFFGKLDAIKIAGAFLKTQRIKLQRRFPNSSTPLHASLFRLLRYASPMVRLLIFDSRFVLHVIAESQDSA